MVATYLYDTYLARQYERYAQQIHSSCTAVTGLTFAACAQGMDTHSNILYVKENFPALSHLAHRTAATDKYRPETCCIIGNYYSLKAQHEKVRLANSVQCCTQIPVKGLCLSKFGML